MRVGIGRFLCFGTRAQFCSQGHTVVQIAGIRWEQFLEDQHKLPEAVFTIVECGAERLIKVSGRGMEGTAERLPIVREHITVLLTGSRRHIDQIEACSGGDVQENCSRWSRHRRSPEGCGATLSRSVPDVYQSQGDGEGNAHTRLLPVCVSE